MRKLLVVAVLFVACAAPTGFPIVGVGPGGVQLYNRGEPGELIPWDQIEGLSADGQLSSENEISPVLRLRTKDHPNLEIASSYARKMDPKSYAGMYVGLSISRPDLEELEATIIKSAGLKAHPESDTVWVKDTNASAAPTETKTYYKKVGKS